MPLLSTRKALGVVVAFCALAAAGEPGIHWLAPAALAQDAGAEGDGPLAQGRAALSAGDFATAERHFRQAVAGAPQSRQALLGLALSLDKLGRSEEAIALFDKLVEAQKDDPTAAFFRGVARYRLGELNGAISDFRAVLEKRSDISEVHLRLGDAYYAKGDIDSALNSYNQALTAPSPRMTAMRALGNALYAKKLFSDAERAYTEALRADPRDGRAALHRAWTRERLGRTEEASEDYDLAVEILGGVDPEVSVARGDLHRRRGELQNAIADYQRAAEIDPSNRAALRGAAAALLADGRPAAAKRILDQLIEQLGAEPTIGASALRLRGEALLRLGQAQAADADFSLALRLEPDVAVAHYNRALARARIDDLAGALDDMRQAASLAPGDPDAAYGHMRAAIAAGLRQEAAEATQAAEKLSETQKRARPARAAALLAFDRPREALILLNAHLAERPRDLRSLHLKIRTLLDLGRNSEALDLARRLIALQPRRAINHLFEAEAHIALKQPAKARLALQRANTLGAAPARIASLAGGAWLADADAGGGGEATPAALQQAANALDAAVSLSNKSPATLAMRAAAREKLGEFEKALEDLDRAVAAQPQDATLRFQRAGLLKKLERCDDAIRDFDAALSLKPGNPDALSQRASCKLNQGRLLGAATDYIASWL